VAGYIHQAAVIVPDANHSLNPAYIHVFAEQEMIAGASAYCSARLRKIKCCQE
jgi:hypothetical protein